MQQTGHIVSPGCTTWNPAAEGTHSNESGELLFGTLELQKRLAARNGRVGLWRGRSEDRLLAVADLVGDVHQAIGLDVPPAVSQGSALVDERVEVGRMRHGPREVDKGKGEDAETEEDGGAVPSWDAEEVGQGGGV